jgi:hypothetical protein
MRPLGEPPCAGLLGELECPPQQLAGSSALVRTAKCRAEIRDRVRILEPGRRVLEDRYRLPKVLDAGGPCFDKPEHAQRAAERARRTPNARQRDLLLCELDCFVRFAKGVVGERGF